MSPLLNQLIEALTCLPGVGPKSATRMAHHILERNRDAGRNLARCLVEAVDLIGRCQLCRTLCESRFCRICQDETREKKLLCIVEMPLDAEAIESATGYRGFYFILGGRLSPLDGIGPKELGLDELSNRLEQSDIDELIIATNPTIEGEATAHYLSIMASKREIVATRIAHGVPMGGELEYIDRTTLAHAFGGRLKIE